MTGLTIGVRVGVARPVAISFEQFYMQTWSVIFDFAATLVDGDRSVAEEVAQETMARVFVRFHRIDDPRPYAFRIAANLVKRRWQLLQREALLDVATMPERPTTSGHDHTVDAVRRLPPRLREAVLLHYYADLPVDVVAHLVHRPPGTVKARLHEARAVLAAALGEDSR